MVVDFSVDLPDVPRCVVCGSTCDDSGLCDPHKYDEQLGNDHEWFQVTVTFGHFDSREEANKFIEEMLSNAKFISGEIKGSWHR